MHNDKIINDINEKFIKFIADSDLRIDDFYMNLRIDELKAYKEHSKEIRDFETVFRIQKILAKKNIQN